jgi:stage III sporulation protein AE
MAPARSLPCPCVGGALVATVVVCVALSIAASVEASGSTNALQQAVQYQAKRLGLDQLQAEMNSLVRKYDASGVDLNLYQWLVTRGQIPLSPGGFLKGISAYLVREVLENTALLGQLMLVAVIAAIASNLTHSLEDDTVARVVSAVLYLVILLIGLSSFSTAASIARNAIDSMVTFVQSLTPTLFSLMVAMGGVSSAAALHPVVLAAVVGFSSVIRGVVVPLTLFSAVLSVVTRVSGKPRALHLSKLLRRSATVIAGLVFGVFIATMTVRGLIGSFGDAVTMKTAKLAAGSFVPVVGTVVADAMEVVAGASLLIKNVIGVAGVLTLAVVCVYPVVKIVAIVLMYRLVSGLVEPLGDTAAGDCLSDLADSLSHLAYCTAATGIMFIVAVTVILSVGALPQMLR